MTEHFPAARAALDIVKDDGIAPDLLDVASQPAPDFLAGRSGPGTDPDKTPFKRTTPSVSSPTDRTAEDTTAQMSNESFGRFGPESDDK